MTCKGCIHLVEFETNKNYPIHRVCYLFLRTIYKKDKACTMYKTKENRFVP